MRAPLFPKKALGVVTLDGQVVAEGSVIEAQGTLSVNCGTFGQSSISVWNGDTEWTPQSVSGNTQYYNVSSAGDFTIRTSEGIILLSFGVVVPQDFHIEATYSYNTSEPTTPGPLAARGSYAQYSSRKIGSEPAVWVHAIDADISNLPLTSNSYNAPTKNPKAPQYGNDWLLIRVKIDSRDINKHIEIKVGDVLVCYIAEITA